ncbi:hypothetical protein JCM16303_003075 [Sporobolomyces ruberrimus]
MFSVLASPSARAIDREMNGHTSSEGDSSTDSSTTSPSKRAFVTTSASSASSPVLPTALSIDTSLVKPVTIGVLLDGDADYASRPFAFSSMFLTRAYTSKRRQGGRCAALELKNHVERHFRKEVYSNSKQIRFEIVVFSFVNMKGLSGFLQDDVASFAQGFNSSPWAFSMSDVGDIPQGADAALKSHLPFLLTTCDHVLFGGTHDNGYEEVLLNLAKTGHRDRVILLRTTPYCAEKILMLGLDEVRFPLLFGERDPTGRSRRIFTVTETAKISLNGNGNGHAPIRSYSDVATTTTAPPALALTNAPSTDFDFKPLIRILLARLLPPAPEHRPLRGGIAYDLKCMTNPPIDFKGKEFKKYSLAAEALGLVELGVGNVEGSEWIRLAIPVKEAREYVQDTSQSPNTTPTSTRDEEESEASFCTLVQVLRSFPNGRTTFSEASSRMVDRGAKLWGTREFSTYAAKAVEARIVETGQVEGEKHEFWIQLTPHYRITRAASSSPNAFRSTSSSPNAIRSRFLPSTVARTVAAPNSIPPKFIPLVQVFVKLRITSTTPHSLASYLACHGKQPFENGRWVEYLEEARKLGIVKLSTVGAGTQWVTVLRTQ